MKSSPDFAFCESVILKFIITLRQLCKVLHELILGSSELDYTIANSIFIAYGYVIDKLLKTLKLFICNIGPVIVYFSELLGERD